MFIMYTLTQKEIGHKLYTRARKFDRQAGSPSARVGLPQPRVPAHSQLLCSPPYKHPLVNQAHRAAPVPQGGYREAPSGVGEG